MNKKRIIAVLSIWSFIHLILFVKYGSVIRSKGEVFWGTHDCWLGKGDICGYDITEFLLYVGSAWLIFVLYYYLKGDNKA